MSKDSSDLMCNITLFHAGVQGMTKEQFMTAMAVDKKAENGIIKFILLKGPLGGCVVTGDFEPAALDATLSAFCPH